MSKMRMKMKITLSLTVTEDAIELHERNSGIEGSLTDLWLMTRCIGLRDLERLGAAIDLFRDFGREYGTNEKYGNYEWDQQGGCWFKKIWWTPTKRIKLAKAKKQMALLDPIEIVVDLDMREGLLRIGDQSNRQNLLDYMRKHGGDESDRKVLRQIAVRKRDPLALEARKLLASWGEDTSQMYPKTRTAPSATQLALWDNLARIIDLCREPTNVKDMMRVVGLSNRRHFNSHYLMELVLRKFLKECAFSGPLRNCYRSTENGLAWVELRKSQGPEIGLPEIDFKAFQYESSKAEPPTSN